MLDTGLTLEEAVLLTPANEAVTVTEVLAVTLPAVTVNVAEVEPWGTVTDEGTRATEEFELESDTTAPPVPADDVRVTVPPAD